MKKLVVTLCFLICTGQAEAKWLYDQTQWLGQTHLTLYHPAEEKGFGFFVSVKSTGNYRFHLIVDSSSVKAKNAEKPFSIKGELFFDGELFAPYQLASGLNVNKFKGLDYRFDDSFLDADMYEKLKSASKLVFRFKNLKNKTQSITIPLNNYYAEFNRLSSRQLLDLVPGEFSFEKRNAYQAMVQRCLAIGEGQVADIQAKNDKIPQEQRMQQVITAYQKSKVEEEHLKFSEFDLKSRVATAYAYYGDTSRPEWLLYHFVSGCFNRQVGAFSS